ncbi:hypothetical protein FQR65_LT10892 [Abscondita terminalis]|nr:hypothetical protein FQR65_LT10892 [Abscondita terminalis]
MGEICTKGEKIPDLQRLKYDMTPIETNQLPIIWIVGPPGTGRHKHAESLANSLQLENVLIADLLRKESLSETDRGRIIKNVTNDPDQKIPDAIVIDLIKEAMLSSVQKKKGFLLNGFPRTSKQANMFVKEISDVDVIIFLNGDVPTLLNRNREKEKFNIDLSESKKQIQNIIKEIKTGVSKFGSKIEKINTDSSLTDVYERIETAVKIRLNIVVPQPFHPKHAHQKFKSLAPEKVGHNKNAKLPMTKILQYPELGVNPFGDRICKVFSSSRDDFDGDDMLGTSDLRQVINRLIGNNQLSENEMQHLIQKILEEADLDDDGALSFAEFEHIIDKSSDFASAFRIRL